ncbi:MAG: cell division control protein Cdc6 [Euryarchaeota archaeon RBG_19FT_COMBO_56_21]|nr:MAG: cell division control protein Cdc6 [Euryarchaeota archaeon RBG_19FT_COMBO_56_21]
MRRNEMQDTIFQQYIRSQSIFKGDRDILRSSYIPDVLPHREEQIRELARILVTALEGNRPSNVLLFGKTGTGKTACMKYIGKEIERANSGLNKVHFIYMNCEVVDTQYGILQNIGNRFIEDFEARIPFTGWSTERVYNILREKIDEEKRVIVIALDEVDQLVSKSGDDVLYHLCRINDDLKNAKVSVIGISNDLRFMEFLDPRVKSSLSEEKMVFPPYNAEQLKDILDQRSKLVLEAGSLESSVIPLCAALAAQEHGDARRALDLLRVAAEIAERNQVSVITESDVIKAKNRIELDCISEAIRTLPIQSKMVLMGVFLNTERGDGKLTTGDLYETYKELCQCTSIAILTQRRITDLISELDMLGIIHARVKSFGRGGRTKEIEPSVPVVEARKILEEDEILSQLKNYKLRYQTTLM